MKGKALRKHSLHEKTAASVLLKLQMNTARRLSTVLPRLQTEIMNTLG